MAMNIFPSSVDVKGKLSSSVAPSSDNDLVTKTYTDSVITVTVANSGSGNKYVIDGTSEQPISFQKSVRIILDQSHSSNSGHPLRFSTTDDGTHGGGSEYSTNVTVSGTAGQPGAYVMLESNQVTPDLLYIYCANHSGMGTYVQSGSVGELISQSNSKVGIGSSSPSHKLDVNGDIRCRGNNLRDNSGNSAITFDGSANTQIDGTLTVAAGKTVTINGVTYTFPSSDGSSGQFLSTNGSGTLSFATASGGGGSGIASVSADSDPTLGGNLKVGGYSIVSTSNGNIAITPNGSGKIVLDGLSWPTADGSSGQYLSTDGSGALSWSTASGGGGSSETSTSYSLGYATLNGSTSGSVSSALTIPSGKTIKMITVDIGTGFVNSYGSGTYATIYFKIGSSFFRPTASYSSYGSVTTGSSFWGYADVHSGTPMRITTSSSTNIELHWSNQSDTLTAGAATIKAWYV
tara:strand:+ start:2986 stop:4368 length:1383 start_codon:yes stop_codon:yes gene_type:complete